MPDIILTIGFAVFPLALIIFEKIYFSSYNFKRDIAVTILYVSNKFLGWLIKTFALVALVNFFAPVEIFSISNLEIPRTLSFVLCLLFLDFTLYATHWSFHKIPFLWRLHRLHHSDKSVDVLTSYLHHPLEKAADFLFGIMFAVLFDIPVPVILTYGLIAGLHSLLTHFKVLLPEKWNKFLSYLIVTPNFHRVHHSLDMKEGNSNFGIVFPYWDRLFGTCISKTYSQMKTIKFGISSNQTPKEQTILKFLINPFISKTN